MFFRKDDLSSEDRRLVDILKKNEGNFTVDRRGVISLDINKKEVKEKLIQQIQNGKEVEVV